ncbi:MAG TPA: MFS transporter [Gemmatimonadaceae bacterium]|nr:MFS transporter [Gemmatimonadaceae bacterium]
MPPQKSLNPIRVLQVHRNFRLFWIGQTVSLIGTWMQTVGQGWLALQLSNSAFIVGVVAAAGSLPVLFFSLYAGVLVDRRDKLRLVTIAQVLLSAEALLLWWAVWADWITIPWLIALATLQGLIGAVEIPARQALIIELVGREDIVDAVALNSGGFNLARIIGPSIAAAVIATAGIAWCFGLNALSYIAVIWCLVAIKLPKFVPVERTSAAFAQFKEGVAYMRSRREVTGLIGVMAIYSIFGFQYLTLMPVIARDVLHTGASGYGLLVTFVGIGAVCGALTLATLGSRVRRGQLFRISAFSFASLLILFSFVNVRPVAAGVLLFLGLTMLINGALANGILQSVVPDELRGRVMAAYVFVYVGFTPIGSLIGGVVAHATSVQWAIGIGGVVMLFYAAWAFWEFPELVRV